MSRKYWIWISVFLLQAALVAWTWFHYIRAWDALHRATLLPTLSDLRLHLQILPVTRYALGAPALLAVTFLAFCLHAIRTHRWWGWLVLFLGETGFVGAVWWAYRIDMFRLEQRMAWDDVLPEGGGTLMANPPEMLAPKLLGTGLILFFMTLGLFCASRVLAARSAQRRMSTLRTSLLVGAPCPACGDADTFRRVTDGFASGKVRRCSTCGHTETIRMEVDLSEEKQPTA